MHLHRNPRARASPAAQQGEVTMANTGIQVQRPGLPAAQAPASTSETASTVLAAQAKALVSARFEIAIRQPRDIDAVRERLMRECQRPSFAQIAIRTRINSRGRTVYLVEATDDEILNQENALVSKALRTTGLRLVPGWLVDECMSAVRATREKGDAADPDDADPEPAPEGERKAPPSGSARQASRGRTGGDEFDFDR